MEKEKKKRLPAAGGESGLKGKKGVRMHTITVKRYIDLCTDFGFKKIFGTEANKSLLTDFLNALLGEAEGEITGITYLNSEQMPENAESRHAAFDVYCRNSDGSYIVVEMQVAEQDHFAERTLFYATFPLREQAQRGRKWKFKFDRVYVVSILDFKMECTHPGDYRMEYVLYDPVRQHQLTDRLKLIYLQLPLFTKRPPELGTVLEKWLYLLRYLQELESPPEGLVGKVFERLFEQAEIARMSKRDQQRYERALLDQWTMNSVMDFREQRGRKRGLAEGRKQGLVEGHEQGLAEGMERGHEQGLAEGMEQGRLAERRLLAERLRADGMDEAAIARLTGQPDTSTPIR